MAEKFQREHILDALQCGNEITPIDALRCWGCFRLGARIWELKQAGIPIDKRTITEDGKQFACYSLKPQFRSIKPDFKREGVQSDTKQSGKAITPRDDKGRFQPTNQTPNQTALDAGVALYGNGLDIRQAVSQVPTLTYEILRNELSQRGVLRHRGQRGQAELFATGAS